MSSPQKSPPVAVACLALATPAWAVGVVALGSVLGLLAGSMVSLVRRTVTSSPPPDLHTPVVVLRAAVAVAQLVTGFGVLVRRARRHDASWSKVATAVASLTAGGVAALGAMLITFVVLNEAGLLGFIEPAEHEGPWTWLLVPATTCYVGVAVTICVAAMIQRSPRLRQAAGDQRGRII